MKTLILTLIKTYYLEIIGFLIGVYLNKIQRQKEWEHFCRQQNLETTVIKSKINKDGKRIEYTDYKFPKFFNKKYYVKLTKLNFKMNLEEVNNNLPNYEKFFKKTFLKAEYDKNKNIILIKELFPKKVLPQKNGEVLLGINQNGKKIYLDFLKGVRLYIAGKSGLGKSTLVETVCNEIKGEVDYYIIGARKSFKFDKQLFYDKDSKEDLEQFLYDLAQLKLQLKNFKADLRSKNYTDEQFSKYIKDIGHPYKPKIFIFDDASTYLKSSNYSKTDEMKKIIEEIIKEINQMLREFRIYQISTIIVAHTSTADEIDISITNYAHILFNRVSNTAQSESATGDKKILMSEILKKGTWYLKSEQNNCYIKSVYNE